MAEKNPSNGKVVRDETPISFEDAKTIVREMADATSGWSKTPLPERLATLRAIGRQLDREKAHLAELMATEMGKPVREGRAEIEKCAQWQRRHPCAD